MNQPKWKTVIRKLTLWMLFMPLLVACNTLPINESGDARYSSEEMRIFTEAVALGAGVGAGGGYILGRSMEKSCEKKNNKRRNDCITNCRNNRTCINSCMVSYSNTKSCDKKRKLSTILGGALGAVIASKVAENQISTLRDVQLKNNKLQQLVNSARQYNSHVSQFNHRLQADIVKLKRLNAQKNQQNKQATIQLAQKQLNAANAQKKAIANTIQSRQTIIRALHPKQQGQLKRELATLTKEERKLNQLIAQSEALNKTVRIGA